MKKIIVLITIALYTVSLLAGCGSKSERYKEGTYTATAEGHGGDMTVEVAFDKDSILSVKVTEQSETEWFFDLVTETLPERIVEAQTWEVDAVTSATITSNAIKTAVKDCIAQAENTE